MSGKENSSHEKSCVRKISAVAALHCTARLAQVPMSTYEDSDDGVMAKKVRMPTTTAMNIERQRHECSAMRHNTVSTAAAAACLHVIR